jgi:hypothetical protein
VALIGGARFALRMEDLFPNGCNLVPDSISEAMDFDEKTRQRTPAKDKVTKQRVWQVRVMDMDPNLAGRSREVTVKVLADYQPMPPTGAPFEPVEFENLQVTPYVGSNGRLAFSIRASAITSPMKASKAAA